MVWATTVTGPIAVLRFGLCLLVLSTAPVRVERVSIAITSSEYTPWSVKRPHRRPAQVEASLRGAAANISRAWTGELAGVPAGGRLGLEPTLASRQFLPSPP